MEAMVPDAGIRQAQDWERELVQQAVKCRFIEGHRTTVLAELARMRAELSAAMSTAQLDAEQLVRFLARAQLDAIEQSAGDPAFFSEQRYKQSDDGLSMDRDRLCALDLIIKDRQLMAKDVASLINMLDVGSTRMDALSALERKGADAARAIPRLVELLRTSDQLECCKVLRTLQGIGPAAQGAVSAIMELASDPDYLISQQARTAVRAIAPERVPEWRSGQ